MKAMKRAGVLKSGVPDEGELRDINRLAKRELAADEVFTFDVRLCDNRVDRDHERFTTGALRALAELFYGKTGIFDHAWSSNGQKARIYRAEVVTDETETPSCGEAYAYLKASAYMLRTEGNDELIREIEGGIKKEVSVGCGVRPGRCSICGEEQGSRTCAHVRGREYGGKLCFAEVGEVTDAYEWSFVAVPAQRDAGVLKRFGGTEGAYGGAEELFKLATLGQRYLNGLREEVVRLGLLGMADIEAETLKSAAGRMEEEELLAFKRAFQAALDKRLPPVCQLAAAKKEKPAFEGEDYLV